jgi:hypothetical protein
VPSMTSGIGFLFADAAALYDCLAA